MGIAFDTDWYVLKKDSEKFPVKVISQDNNTITFLEFDDGDCYLEKLIIGTFKKKYEVYEGSLFANYSISQIENALNAAVIQIVYEQEEMNDLYTKAAEMNIMYEELEMEHLTLKKEYRKLKGEEK